MGSKDERGLYGKNVLTNPTFQWGQNLLEDILPIESYGLCYNTVVDTSVTVMYLQKYSKLKLHN